MFKFTDKNGTTWKIAPIPLGGYVKIKGLDNIFSKNSSQDKGSFQSLTLFQKISVLLAGSVFNIVSAWLALFSIFFFFGIVNFLPIIGGFFLAMGNVTTWRLCSKESPLTLTLFFFSIIGFFGLLGIITFSFFDVSSEDLNVPSFFIGGWSNGSFILWLLIIIQSIGSMIGIALLTKAYQMADTSYLNVFEYSFFIFAGFAGWIILGQLISNFELLGIVLIIIAGIIVSLAGKKK